MSRSGSPDKATPAVASKATCAFCFSHMTQCRCSPYKVTAHRLQTKAIPELEHDVRQSTAQIEVLKDMLEAANHKYDDVTRPLVAQVEELTARVKNLSSQVRKRDDKILALQESLQDQREERKRCEVQISELMQHNDNLTSTIHKLVRCDICQAAKAGDVATVALWISLRCDVNKRDHECVNEIQFQCMRLTFRYTDNGLHYIGHLGADVVTLQSCC